MKKHLTTLLLIAIFIAGLCILLYPSVSDYWNSMVQSKAIVDYEAALSNLTQKDYTDAFEAAYAYNAALREVDFPLMYFDKLDEREDLQKYEDILNINGNGIMGYISIPKIKVELPIYHGTSARIAFCPRIEGCRARSCLPIWTRWRSAMCLRLRCSIRC